MCSRLRRTPHDAFFKRHRKANAKPRAASRGGIMAKRKSLYSAHPSIAMVQKWIAELKKKTGRTLDDWLKLIEKDGPSAEAERRVWLKTKFKLGTNSASWLAERSVGKGLEDGDPAL